MAPHRLTAPRVQPIPKLLELSRKKSKAANVNATMAHHRKLGLAFGQLFQVELNECETPRRQREIVILRTGWNCQAEYEFGQHTLYGRQAGLTEAEIYAVTRPIKTYGWSEEDAVLLQMADDLYSDDAVSDATWAELTARWSIPEVYEFVCASLSYRVVSGLLNTLGVQLDEGVPGWPTAPVS